MEPPLDLLPAPLPRRAKLIGGIALLCFLAAFSALVRDLVLGSPVGTAFGFTLGFGLSLLWVLADFPVRYELSANTFTVVTRLRRVSLPRKPMRFLGSLGRDRFAINGGFGWYGWFHSEGRIVRAWVTDPDCAWVMEGDRATVFSPVDGAMCRDLAAGEGAPPSTSRRPDESAP